MELADIAKIKKGIQLNKKDIKEKGLYPVINGGINPSGYVDFFNEEKNTITMAQGGSAGFVNFMNSNFYLNAHAYAIKPDENLILNRFMFHYLKSKQNQISKLATGTTILGLSIKSVQTLKIPIPPLEIQEKIVKILDAFSLLTAEQSLRAKQYAFYRDYLLSEKYILKFTSKLEYKELEEVCEIYDGTHQTPKYKSEGIKFISVENIKNPYASKKFISIQDYEKQYKNKKVSIGDILMTRIGSIGVCNVIKDNKEDLAYYVTLALLKPNHKIINSSFLRHFIESIYGKKN